MKKSAMLIFTLVLIFCISSFYAGSLWDKGVYFYKINVKPGDIVKIMFLEKTIMKYKLEQRQSDYQSRKGVKGKGEIFSFFPEIEITGDDTIRDQNNFSLDNEESFSINAKITSVNNTTANFEGFHSTLMGGEIFKLQISGEFDINSLEPGSSIASTDVYDLDFRVLNQNLTNAAMFSRNDLVFSTNYSEIQTNQVISSNNITNTQLTTNLSSFKIEFTGIADSKKQELLMNYLNTMINLLFR